jgi:hypothetical protein
MKHLQENLAGAEAAPSPVSAELPVPAGSGLPHTLTHVPSHRYIKIMFHLLSLKPYFRHIAKQCAMSHISMAMY